MSKLSELEIDHLAKLARLTLSVEEKKQFAGQLPEILVLVDKLDSQSTVKDEIETKTEATLLTKLRPDEPSGDQLTLDQLENLAPAWRDGQVEVPAVFSEVKDEG